MENSFFVKENCDLTLSIKQIDFTCSNGHKWKATDPFTVVVMTDPPTQPKSICPYCYVEWVTKNVPEAVMVEG